MMLRLLLSGHRSVLTAFLTVGTLLTALAGGVIGTAIRATKAADGFRDAGNVTTDTAAQWANYKGTADYTFLVAALACIVGMVLLSSVAQFTVAGVAATSRGLRLLGASRRRIRYGLTLATAAVSALALALGTALAPFVAVAFRWILERAGMPVAELGSTWMTQPTLLAGASLLVWGVCSVWWQARRLAGIEADIPVPTTTRRIAKLLATPLRYGVGIAAGVGLWAMLGSEMTMENYNEMSFGIALCTLFVVWSLTPPVLRGIGWLLRRSGTGRMIVGGVASSQGRRIAGMSLIAALLIVLGGTSSFAALASSTGSTYQGAASLQSDAVTRQALTPEQTVAAQDAGITVSRLDTDAGWLEGENSVDAVPANRVDPEPMDRLLLPGTVTAGSLADVAGDSVAADDRYEVGETVHIRDDGGLHREVRVVATLDRESDLGSGITVDAASFPVSASGVDERTYASGELSEVRTAVPGVEWTSRSDELDEGIGMTQHDQMTTLAGMVGGIGVVAVVALLHAVIGFASDLRGTQSRLRRISFSWARVTGVFGGLGVTVGLAAGVISAAALAVAQWALSGMLTDLGVTTAMDVPWPLLLGLWAVVVVASVAGMAAQPVRAAVPTLPWSGRAGVRDPGPQH